MEALAVAPGTSCLFEQIVTVCPGLTWYQIFYEVDRMSREGQVHLSQEKPGVYRVRSPKSASVTPAGSGMGHESTEEKRNNHNGCRRCEGLLVPEQLPELLLDSGPLWGWRCVQCGHIVDPVAQGRYAEQAHATCRSTSPRLPQ